MLDEEALDLVSIVTYTPYYADHRGPYAASEAVRTLEAIRLPRLLPPQRCLDRAAD